MLIERPPAATHHHHHIPRWLRIVGICFFGIIIASIVVLATHWPFSREAMTRALEEATSRPVEIGAFHQSYFPPGCMAENVRVLHNSNPGGEPLITIEKLLVQGSLTGMFGPTKRLAQVKIVGMHLRIPPKGKSGGKNTVALNSGKGAKSIAISKIIADGALLEFLPSEPGEKPYRLRIDGLDIRGVGDDNPMTYRVNLTNSEPPGVIRAEGKFGPWNPDDPGVTPVSGTFTYNDVKLGVFHGIAGTLQSKGKFEGPLGKIRAEGAIEVPNFHVDESGSAVRLAVGFHAVVNGTNGDTYLEPVDAHFLRTRLIARGGVEGHKGEKGKTTTLNLSIPDGRIQDVLRLFVHEKTAPMTGALRLHGKFFWPPGPRKFVEKIRMDLDFGIDDGKFRSEKTQDTIDRIGKSGQGESKDDQESDARTMLSDLRGHVAFREGIATFSHVSFTVPGASAIIRGTYGLVDKHVDLHGVLTTKGKLSDATTGFKAVVAKLLTPFFKKKNDIKMVPFKITGTFEHATVSLD
jgi:hypothetical protein